MSSIQLRDILRPIFQNHTNAEIEELYPYQNVFSVQNFTGTEHVIGKCTNMTGCRGTYTINVNKHITHTCGNPLCDEFVRWKMNCGRFGDFQNYINIISGNPYDVKIRRSSGEIQSKWSGSILRLKPNAFIQLYNNPSCLTKIIPLDEFLEINPTIKFDAVCVYTPDWNKFVSDNPNVFPKYASHFLRQ